MGARNEEQQKAFARRFAAQGIGVAMAGYRLSPQVTFPTYVTHAAAAVKWVVDHAASLGSSPALIYVGGHSAGGGHSGGSSSSGGSSGGHHGGGGSYGTPSSSGGLGGSSYGRFEGYA